MSKVVSKREPAELAAKCIIDMISGEAWRLLKAFYRNHPGHLDAEADAIQGKVVDLEGLPLAARKAVKTDFDLVYLFSHVLITGLVAISTMYGVEWDKLFRDSRRTK